MSLTDATENVVLDAMLGAGGGLSFTDPIYIGVSTTIPNDDGTNFTEPAGGAYARVSVVNQAAQWPAAVAGVKNNGVAVTFVQATAAWGTLKYFGIFTALAGGVPILYGTITPNIAITAGDTLSFPIGNITVEIT